MLKRGQLALADAYCEQILRLHPGQVDALHLSGVIALQTGDPQRAVDLISKATAARPDNAKAYRHLGAAYQALKRWEAALESYDRAITLEPQSALAYFNRGSVLQQLRRFHAALTSFNQAIALSSDWAEAYFHRGCVLGELGEIDAALASYDQAIAIRVDYAEAHLNRGLALQEIHDLDAALASYDRALAIRSDYADAHFNRAMALFLRGDLATAWIDYEWRWRNDGESKITHENRFSQPPWLGKEPVAGKVILLYGEQGLGDTLQFCRYASRVAELNATVILEVQEPLVALLASLKGVSRVIARGNPLPEFDCHCSLMSLPLAFQTTLETIPSATRYLSGDPIRVAQWQARLGERTRPRIGLAWSGSTSHVNDHNRNIPLVQLIEHLPESFQYVSLQKDVRALDRPTLESSRRIRDVSDDLGDFSDTAALCECLDLVISVDTSVAHLSAALGKTTWILLPFNPDWRWLLDREDSPWYPSARLHRQQRIGDWYSVLERIVIDLAAGSRGPEPGAPWQF